MPKKIVFIHTFFAIAALVWVVGAVIIVSVRVVYGP